MTRSKARWNAEMAERVRKSIKAAVARNDEKSIQRLTEWLEDLETR